MPRLLPFQYSLAWNWYSLAVDCNTSAAGNREPAVAADSQELVVAVGNSPDCYFAVVADTAVFGCRFAEIDP